MKIIDISWPLSPATTGYKDRKDVQFEATKKFDLDNARQTEMRINCHAGTHIDAPSHFLRDGNTIDQIPLQHLVGPCKVFDCTDVSEEITDTVLRVKEQKINIGAGDIILLKTSNSELSATAPFAPHFVYLHQSGARYLAEKKMRTVGIDYLGIERNQPGHPTHRMLLEHGIVIIEGLRLSHVHEGRYLLYCLPLALLGVEAAPARAILLTEK